MQLKCVILVCVMLFVTLTTGSQSEEADELPRKRIEKGMNIPDGDECFCETRDNKREQVAGGDICCKKSEKGTLLSVWGTEEEPQAEWCAISPDDKEARTTYQNCCAKLEGNGICDPHGTFVKDEHNAAQLERTKAAKRRAKERAKRRKERKQGHKNKGLCGVGFC